MHAKDSIGEFGRKRSDDATAGTAVDAVRGGGNDVILEACMTRGLLDASVALISRDGKDDLNKATWSWRIAGRMFRSNSKLLMGAAAG